MKRKKKNPQTQSSKRGWTLLKKFCFKNQNYKKQNLNLTKV